MESARRDPSFELVKRDGHHEEYNREKLARSLARAGVARYLLAGILDVVAPHPDEDTGLLRAIIECELEQWQPVAARRFAQTRRLHTFGSGALSLGSVNLHPETAARFGTRHGETIWLGENGAWAPLVVKTQAQVEPNQAWLNSAVLADMGIDSGSRLLVTSRFPGMPRRGTSNAPVAWHDTPALVSPR
jgi:hypothetical protein